jgi:hypothetical protein
MKTWIKTVEATSLWISGKTVFKLKNMKAKVTTKFFRNVHENKENTMKWYASFWCFQNELNRTKFWYRQS